MSQNADADADANAKANADTINHHDTPMRAIAIATSTSIPIPTCIDTSINTSTSTPQKQIQTTPTKLSRLSLTQNRRTKRKRQRNLRDQSQSQSQFKSQSQGTATEPATEQEIDKKKAAQNSEGEIRTEAGATIARGTPNSCKNGIENTSTSTSTRTEMGKASQSSCNKRPRISYDIDEDDDDDDDETNAVANDLGLLTQPTGNDVDDMDMDRSRSHVHGVQESMHEFEACISPMNQGITLNITPNANGNSNSNANANGVSFHNNQTMRKHLEDMDFATPRRSGTQKLQLSSNIPNNIGAIANVDVNVNADFGFDTDAVEVFHTPFDTKESAQVFHTPFDTKESENDNVNVNVHEDDEEDESPEKKQADYCQRVAANRKRNQQRLVDLGLSKEGAGSAVHDDGGDGIGDGDGDGDGDGNESSSSVESGREATGMLFATSHNSIRERAGPLHISIPDGSERENVHVPVHVQDQVQVQVQDQVQSLFDIFPHREKEINLLQSCLKNAVRQTEITNASYSSSSSCGEFSYVTGSMMDSYIPPPIFVTGPSGSGKTSVVRGVLKQMQREVERTNKIRESMSTSSIIGSRHGKGNGNGRNRNKSIRLGVAYIDCSTIEAYGSGVGAVLENTYSQLAKCFCPEKDKTRRSSRKGGLSKVSRGGGSLSLLDNDSLASGSDSFDLGTDDDSYTDSSLDTDSLSAGGGDDDDVDDDNQFVGDEEDLMEKTAARERGAYRKEARATSSSSVVSRASKTSRGKDQVPQEARRRSSRLKGGDEPSKVNASIPRVRKKGSALKGLLSTPAVFGRSISQFCGVSGFNSFQRGCAFLVLDQASNLLSFSNTKQRDSARTNFLSELLLLPKVMKLNLTIIVITDKLFLENTRINNIEHPMNTFGTIVAAVAPLKCHFGAYRDKQMFRDVSHRAIQ